jgi:hypothetical protein
MTKNNFAPIALVCVGLAVAPTAVANELGFYIGGYVGQASRDPDHFFYTDLTEALQEFAVFQPTQERTSFDHKDTAYSLYAGYRLNRYLAFEGGYAKLGTISSRSRATGNFPQEPGSLITTLESEMSGFTVSALGWLPLTRDWEVFVRGGALFAQNKLSFNLRAQGNEFIPPTGPDLSASLSDGGTDYFAGVGITRRVLEIYDVRLEYQRVFDAGLERTGGEVDMDLVQLGVTVTF